MTHNIRVTCPICEKADAVPVVIETFPGLRATRDSPAEPRTFNAMAPETCPACGVQFTDEEITELEQSAEAWLLTPEDA